jgi:hypothetical protein
MRPPLRNIESESMNEANTLDAANRCSFGPLSFAHMGFGMVNAECFHFDKNGAWLRYRIRQILNDQAIETPKLFDDDCSHTNTPFLI